MKILVAGCGSIGARHAGNAAALAQEAAVFDLDAGKAKIVAQQTGARAFSSYDEALGWKPDGVVVATPHKTHIAMAEKATRAGAHVLIEKPISHDVSLVSPLLALAQEKGRRVLVVCNMRFHPAIQCLRENLARTGNIYFARAHFGNYLPNMRPGADYRDLYCARRDQGGGVILDAIHEIDYLAWLLGSVKGVSCEAAKRSNLEIDVEDYAALTMIHENGVRSEIHLDYLQTCKRRGCEIVGDRGTLIWQSEGKNPESCTVRFFDAQSGAWWMLLDDKALDAMPMYRTIMEKFMNSMKGHPDADLLDGATALVDLRVALAAHESAARGGRVL